MNRESIFDELRRVEFEVVERERMPAEHEARLVALTKEKLDTRKAQATWNLVREDQLGLDQERQRLLSLLQP